MWELFFGIRPQKKLRKTVGYVPSVDTFSDKPLVELAVKYTCWETGFLIQIVVIIGLVLFAGMTSGLTIGLMSLSRVDLEVLAKSGTPKGQETCPEDTSPPEKPTPGAVLKLSGTKYGLAIGATLAPFVRVLVWGTKYNKALFRREELKTLVDFHGNEAGNGGDLSHHEAIIIAGALELSEKTAGDAMTPISKTFAIDVDAKLDRSLKKLILDKGHSWIPVYNGDLTNISGVILVKSLLTIPAEVEVPVKSVTIRKIPKVEETMPLYDILNEFQKGHSHMAVVVRRKNEKPDEEEEEESKRVDEVWIEIDGGKTQLENTLKTKRTLHNCKIFPNNHDCGRSGRIRKWTNEENIILDVDGNPLPKLPEEEEEEAVGALPKKFVNNLRKKLAGSVVLQGPTGDVWNVGIKAFASTLYFKNGWKEFVQDNSLEENDVLFFKYMGNSRFDVVMFDQKSSCEKEGSCFMRRCKAESVELDANQEMKDKLPAATVEEVAGESSSEVSNESPASKKHKRDDDTGTTSKSDGNPLLIKANDQGSNKKEHNAYDIKYRKLLSNWRPVTNEMKEKALNEAIALAAETEASFVMNMIKSHVLTAFYVSIPAQWARKHLPFQSQYKHANLVVEENTWQVKFRRKGNTCGLGSGWKNFAAENYLEESDALVFGLVNKTTDSITFNVRIFRVVEKNMKLKQAMLTTSRRVIVGGLRRPQLNKQRGITN
ncbi:OLC1v1017819C1 [Oldenlandia corymbosa var. corymbosa]|uniref:OLC1v1017819C1 n=1 Tax=Oldenlandia corymbosa var. corymbosa TaxID=529605 RepID=A0AAV1EAB2_OLDCO|nr:OLC1v1017819C1 [Oldenlandia corymbosa var. corymbosa]